MVGICNKSFSYMFSKGSFFCLDPFTFFSYKVKPYILQIRDVFIHFLFLVIAFNESQNTFLHTPTPTLFVVNCKRTSMTVQKEDHSSIASNQQNISKFIIDIRFQKSLEQLQLQNKCVRVSGSRLQKEYCGKISSLN